MLTPPQFSRLFDFDTCKRRFTHTVVSFLSQPTLLPGSILSMCLAWFKSMLEDSEQLRHLTCSPLPKRPLCKPRFWTVR